VSVLLKRHGKLEVVQLERKTGIDGQGKPAYATAVAISARVKREDAVVQSSTRVLMQPGDQINIIATAWIDEAQRDHPAVHDRLTLADGLKCIVVERKERDNIQGGSLDHVRVKLREE
jgi:hypothetical protein